VNDNKKRKRDDDDDDRDEQANLTVNDYKINSNKEQRINNSRSTNSNNKSNTSVIVQGWVWCNMCERYHHGPHRDDLAAKAPKSYPKYAKDIVPKNRRANNVSEEANTARAEPHSKKNEIPYPNILSSVEQLTKLQNENNRLKAQVASMAMTPSTPRVGFTEMFRSSANDTSYMIVNEAEISDNHIHVPGNIADSGASTTMTPEINKLTNITELPKKKYVTCANGDKEVVQSTGNMGDIPNVLAIPKLKDTLLSISQLDLMFGYYTLFGNKIVEVYDRRPRSQGCVEGTYAQQ
jgi:hypothetical protein